MKYLGHPEATLVTMWVAARHLATRGPATQDNITSALRPPHLTSGEGLALKTSLTIGTDLGVFVQGEEAIPLLDLGPSVGDRSQWFDEFDGFASVARRLLMNQAERSPDEQSDVAIAVAWLLSCDWRRPSDPVPREGGAPRSAVTTSEQLTTFARWCRELGYGRGSRGGVFVDPTAAVRRELASLRPGTYSARDFVNALSPALPTGPRHRLVGELSAREDLPAELELFSAVGLALKRLEREQVLSLIVRDDADERIIYRFPGPTSSYIPVTHVEVGR